MFRLFSFCFFFFAGAVQAQTYTLQQCIDTALANNIGVQQAGLLTQSAGVQLSQSKFNRLPDLSADVFHGLSQGRSIDPNSNSYVNQSLNYASYGVNSGITVFYGGTLRNTIKQNAASFEASGLETQQAKDNLVLNVIITYLQVLNGEDLVRSSAQQAELSQKAIDRLQVLDNQGAIKPSELSDLKGQLMNDQLAVATARNVLETAKLNLAQLMNKPYTKELTVQRIALEEIAAEYKNTPSGVYQNALQQFAQIKAVEFRKQSAEYGVKAAKGNFYPSVSIGGGLATNYSSLAQNASGKIPYNGQLKNNISTSVGVGLSIPIFSRMQVRNRVRQADILWNNSKLQEDLTKVTVRQQIEQAYLNMTNAYERYTLLQSQVAAYTQSFKAAEVRYASGVGTSYDYLIAKDRMDRANINLIGAQYDYVLRKKVLDYYGQSLIDSK
ncbi:MAG: TolC family protein [Flaviaesturariibacter sp.]|nr:TolC family protein [Flaviaesturariibacter sp.]